MMINTTLHPTTIKIDHDTRERVKRLAEARQRTPHWMILEAVRQYLEREEKREAFRQDGIRAWNSYRETGSHVTQSEADVWLAKLEEGENADPPECHA